MDEEKRLKCVEEELEAIYEDFDANVNQQILLRKFLKNILNVAKGADSAYKLSDLIQK